MNLLERQEIINLNKNIHGEQKFDGNSTKVLFLIVFTILIMIGYSYYKNRNYNNIFYIEAKSAIKNENRKKLSSIINKNPEALELSDKKGWNLLHIASKSGNPEIIDFLLKKGININSRTQGRLTPLHIAACEGDLDVVKNLVINKANINSKDYSGSTPIYRSSIKNPEILRFLIKNGGEINSVNKNGLTPLHWQVQWGSKENVKELLKNGAEINAQTVKGWTPLHKAASIGRIDTINELLKYNPEKNIETINGYTPLTCSVYSCQKDAEDLLRSIEGFKM